MASEILLNLDQFIQVSFIGSGSYGEVYLIEDRKTHEKYAAKISLKVLSNDSRATIQDLDREINIISKISHPSILRFIGFCPNNFYKESKPVIITEYLSNGSLRDVIELEKCSRALCEWTHTRKLVNIYGIASGMSYLHKHDIIHRDLKPENILIDDFLCPKIGDFGLSKTISKNGPKSTNFVKGTPIYISPEVWTDANYTKACDVYSFGMIIYEIIICEDPWHDLDENKIKMKVINGLRPLIPNFVDNSYRKLIESCLSQDPNDRPTFDTILELLKTDEGFLTDEVVKEDFYDYVDFIDSCPTSFNEKSIEIDKFIKRKSLTFNRVSLIRHKKAMSEIVITNGPKRMSKKTKKCKIVFPLQEFNKLNEECQSLVQEAEKDINMQFTIGQCLIEGLKGFNQNTEIGLAYISESANNGCSDAAIYYARILIKGDLIEPDLKKAMNLLKEKCIDKKNGTVLVIMGIIRKKEMKFTKAFRNFEDASKVGNAEAMYRLGKMLYKGQGCDIDKEEAMKWFRRSQKNGFNKNIKFLNQEESKNEKSTIFKSSLQTDIKPKNTVNKESDDNIINDPDNLLGDKKNDTKSYDGYNMYSIENYSDVEYEDIMYSDSISSKGEIIQMDENKSSHYSSLTTNKTDIESMYIHACKLFKGEMVPIDKKKAIRLFKIAADNGNIDAMVKYSHILLKGNGTQMNKEEAAHYIKMAADSGNVISMFEYARMLSNGIGVTVNHREAIHYFKMAADKGHIDSMYEYGYMIFKGYGIHSNKNEGLRYYKMAADNGNIDAMSDYGSLLIKRKSIKDKSEGIYYLQKAAKNNDPQAMQNYGYCLLNGIGVEINKKKAAHYFKMAANKGNIDAMYRYAKMLIHGDGIDLNKKKGLHYLKMAADNGDLIAMSNYGTILINDKSIKDKSEGIYYLKMSADNKIPKSMYMYGHCLFYGIGVRINKLEASRYFKMAADKGNIDAMHKYGIILYYGEGVPMNKKEGLHYFKMAADNGHIESMNKYGKMLYYGEGVNANKKKGLHYLKMAADKGCIIAMSNYGACIINDDSRKDKSEGIYYVKMAADNKIPIAMYNYGYCLFYGKGVKINKTKAIHYYQMAAKKGNIDAMDQCSQIFYYGKGVPVNKKEGLRYFKMAADNGLVSAMNNYGSSLINDDSISDKSEGMHYLKMAVDNEFPLAWNNYGYCLLNGKGVPMNKPEAARYFKMAIDAGNKDAMRNYGNMLSCGNGIPMNKKEGLRYINMAKDNI